MSAKNGTADRLHGLRTLIVRAVREETGLHERLAVPVAESILRRMQRELGGQEVHIPAESAASRMSAIREARDAGLPVAEICQSLSVSRATVYRAFSDRSDAFT